MTRCLVGGKNANMKTELHIISITTQALLTSNPRKRILLQVEWCAERAWCDHGHSRNYKWVVCELNYFKWLKYICFHYLFLSNLFWHIRIRSYILDNLEDEEDDDASKSGNWHRCIKVKYTIDNSSNTSFNPSCIYLCV